MKKINVTKTFLPPIEEYQEYLRQIWDDVWLTNQGPLLKELETRTKDYLGVDNLQLVGNGTLALQVALRALDITEGEIITTPFTYVATTSAILWEKLTPVYVDIEPDTLCIDASKIEAAITKNTKAILAVHVYGNPCDVEAIEAIAQKHNLKVIYDAAHAFGVTYKGKSLLECGDISICSFHSTKLFHTIEGGAIIARNEDVREKAELIKRFGHNGDDHIMLGINAKANEFQAAMGLCNLKYIDKIIAERKHVFELYNDLLDSTLQRPVVNPHGEHNYGYYPVEFRDEAELLEIVAALNKENIFPRRYFYPSLNRLSYVSSNTSCPVSEDVASRVLCIPLYAGLEDDDVQRIAKIINTVHAAAA